MTNKKERTPTLELWGIQRKVYTIPVNEYEDIKLGAIQMMIFDYLGVNGSTTHNVLYSDLLGETRNDNNRNCSFSRAMRLLVNRGLITYRAEPIKNKIARVYYLTELGAQVLEMAWAIYGQKKD